ncbi:hypothetical protein SIID45300_02261 [Candidatus Magnetaquicoccaceae bacterium FCR-1]|uniref:Uncharacterized protein n=1 Tax=Candidatus Magnetaquiglobus chichijimensis TaxID=3141448 RepID=A0ABQ0CAL7_9PROT
MGGFATAKSNRHERFMTRLLHIRHRRPGWDERDWHGRRLVGRSGWLGWGYRLDNRGLDNWLLIKWLSRNRICFDWT